MMSFKSIFFFELKRRLRLRDIIIFFITAVLILLLAQHGKRKYLNAFENREVFQEAETAKVSQYSLYRQYGAFGISLLFIPSPYSTFFSDYAFEGLLANINISDRLNIYKPVKGKSFFIARSGFMSFAGIILLFGTFGGLLYGYDSVKSKALLRLLSSITGSGRSLFAVIISRIIILNLAFLILIGISILSILIDNINLFHIPLIFIGLVFSLLITFFFAVGCIIGSLKKSIRRIAFATIYFISVALIPFIADVGGEINAADIEGLFKFELVSFKTIMEKDKSLIDKFGSLGSDEVVSPELVKSVKNAVKNEHVKIRERENIMKNHMSKKIRNRQIISSIFPVLFYLSVNKELSSQGGDSILDFYSFAQQRKKEFIDFYVKKRFLGKKNPDNIGQVENFIKSDENLFYGQSHLPKGFILGIGLTVFYIAVLFFILYRMHSIKTKREIKMPQIEFEKGQNSLFVLCENDTIKHEIFRFYENQKNTSCVDKIITDPRFDDLQPNEILHYFCNLSNTDEKKALENLSMVGIKDLNTLKISHENILKIYAAVKISADSQYIIFNDFFKEESRRLEEDFSKLLHHLKTSGKKILYLSCEMYYPKESLNEKISIKNFGLLPLNFDKVTLR